MPKLFLLLGIFCIAWGEAIGQAALLEKKVSLIAKDVPIYKVLEEIEQKYQIHFSYFEKEVLLNKKITIEVGNETLQKVLKRILFSSQMQFQVIGSQIVLKKASQIQDTKLIHIEHLFRHTSPAEKDSNLQNNDFQLVSVTAEQLQEEYVAGKFVHYNKNSTTDFIDNAEDKVTIGKLSKRLRKYRSQFRSDVNHEKKVEYIFLQPVSNPLTYHLESVREKRENDFQDLQMPLSPPAEKLIYTQSIFQLALLPGLSTHGIHPGEYTNHISFNILAGYSAGNHKLEIGGLSNFNQHHVYGLQVGGLANVVGGNKFAGLSQAEKLQLKKGNIESNMNGVQLAGLTNIIAGNIFGWQTAGGINVVEKSLQGFQLAGVSNLVETYSFGVQVAGVSNVSMESVDGVQVAGLYNYTDGEMHGIQISALNQAGFIEGRRSLISSANTGLQIGIINTAKRMNGYQVGLINVGGNMAGTQIGLINIHRNKKGNGTPIGLLNITSSGHFARLYTSELFMSNLDISTGSLRIQNILNLGYNPISHLQINSPKWSLGYSIGKIIRPGSKYFYSYDIGLSHINRNAGLTKELSFLSKIRGSAGYKLHFRKMDFSVFGGLTFNAYLSQGDALHLSPSMMRIGNLSYGDKNIELWPGFMLGIHL